MPQKKTNGFLVFVMEWREKNDPKLSVPDAISRANPLWQKMSNEKKQYYKEKAKANPKIPGKKTVRLTSDGTPVDFIMKKHREKEEKEKQMTENISKTVSNALNNGQILSKKFYFIMIHHFERRIHSEDYVPAEIGIIEFSLIDGVNRKYHSYVNPDVDFYGNLFLVQQHAEDTHKLPLPPNALPCKESEAIFRDILNFIYDQQHDIYPPLYTHKNHINVVNSCMEFLMGEEEASKSNLDIYSIHSLFYNLKSAASDFAGINKKPSSFITDVVLDRDQYEYDNGLACKYHDEIDRSRYCALSQVVRWGFIFADFVGKDFNLDFKPGRHMPGTYNAEIVMSSSQNNTENVESLTDALSELSVPSHYDTCEDYMSAKSHTSTAKLKAQRDQRNVTAPTISCHQNTSQNYWKRLDTSQPPDSQHFSIDESEKPSTSRRSRQMGRGIAIFDDQMKNMFGGRGRSFNL